jgi:flagellar motor switch protein FliM
MVAHSDVSVMRRLVRSTAPPPSEPLTPYRALRQAVTRAAAQSIGLSLTVLGISEETGPLDDILSRVEPGLMLVALESTSGYAGLAGIDLQTRAALIEVQTLGRVSPATAQDRPPTGADLVMADPFLKRALHEIVLETTGTSLDGWAEGYRLSARIPGPRDAGLALPDGAYRILRLTLDLGAGGRQGLLVIALPLPGPADSPPPPQDPPAAWSAALGANVLSAAAEVRAVLHRMRLSLRVVEDFEPGQIIGLTGASVATVRVEAPDGSLLAPARLGQMSGMRAIRLGPPNRPDMDEMLPPPPAGD